MNITPKIKQAPPAIENEIARRLRVAVEQWPYKSPEDREHERRLIARDMAALEALRNG